MPKTTFTIPSMDQFPPLEDVNNDEKVLGTVVAVTRVGTETIVQIESINFPKSTTYYTTKPPAHVDSRTHVGLRTYECSINGVIMYPCLNGH
jgi:hypothetical protein